DRFEQIAPAPAGKPQGTVTEAFQIAGGLCDEGRIGEPKLGCPDTDAPELRTLLLLFHRTLASHLKSLYRYLERSFANSMIGRMPSHGREAHGWTTQQTERFEYVGYDCRAHYPGP